MSISEWIAVAVGLPLMIAVGWIQSVRVWRTRADVSAGVSWFTGQASVAGYHAFLLPATIAMTLLWLGIDLDQFGGDGVTSAVATWLLASGLACMVLAFWMWVFAWPRFLVPPHLRGQPGWWAASRREWRASRERKKAAAGYRAHVGKRAARDDT